MQPNAMTYFEPVIRHIAVVNGYGIHEGAVRAGWHHLAALSPQPKEAPMFENEMRELQAQQQRHRDAGEKVDYIQVGQAINTLNRRIATITAGLEAVGWRWMPGKAGVWESNPEDGAGRWVKFGGSRKQLAVEGDGVWSRDFALAERGTLGSDTRKQRILTRAWNLLTGGKHAA